MRKCRNLDLCPVIRRSEWVHGDDDDDEKKMKIYVMYSTSSRFFN